MAETSTLTSEQEHVLMHMLGIDDPSVAHPKEYRDYYCANPNDATLHGLVRLGLVEVYSAHGGYEWFTTTDAGKAAARAAHGRMLYPKKRRVYIAYLRVSDAICGLTFRDFLTMPEFAETRRTAK